MNITGEIPVALTIAGSDSGGGAGIQADLRTFAALRAFGTSAITLITAQNTQGVSRVDILANDLVEAQIDAVMTDFNVKAAKTGALGNRDVILSVAQKVMEFSITNLVIDPVMISKHGHELIERSARTALIENMFPKALLITPNAFEAQAILGSSVDVMGDPESAVRALVSTGARAALLKGGHLSAKTATDYFFDGATVHVFESERIETEHTHGTGCTLSAAITAYLARGFDLYSSVKYAKKFVEGAILNARAIGKGISSTHQMHEFYSWDTVE